MSDWNARRAGPVPECHITGEFMLQHTWFDSGPVINFTPVPRANVVSLGQVRARMFIEFTYGGEIESRR